MNSLKAHVKNGRIVLNEPTSLPEGEVIELVPLAEALANGADDLDADERARLDAELDASWAEVREGSPLASADDVLARVKASR